MDYRDVSPEGPRAILDSSRLPAQSREALALAREVAAGRLPQVRVRIVSIGGRAEDWLNCEKIVEFDRDFEDRRKRYAVSKFPSPGFEHFGMARRGHIGLQDHDDVVFFRNIHIRRL